MESSFLSILLLLSLLLLFSAPHFHSFSNKRKFKCPQNERNALLEFKATFYDKSCILGSFYHQADLKTWTVEGKNGDCCNWDGIECDKHSGHVIGLELPHSCLSGSINSNSSIFKLVHLRKLDLSWNDFGYSKLPPTISNLSQLEGLNLGASNFSGQIPLGLLNLTNLSGLFLFENQLILKNPSLGDLVQSLIKLEGLVLDDVEMSTFIPNSLFRLTSLQILSLCSCKLHGQIPPLMANLTKLEEISLFDNHFTGEIFPHLVMLTKLSMIDLSFNKFSGQIPRTISHLKNLILLFLTSNCFSGKTQLDVFFQLESLEWLVLSHNNISPLINSNIKPMSKLELLELVSCNLKSFPLLLQGQDRLDTLDLSSNDISGEVPQWFMDTSVDNLRNLNLSHNHLSGSLPIPFTATSLQYYIVSNNEFSGELPIRMCNLAHLDVFDIGHNNLSGMIPQCLANLVGMGGLSVLNLHNNNLNGPIPQVGKNICNLMMVDLSYNQLEGPVPRNLENCPILEFLNLGNNKIIDIFPFWLGKLPTLSILVLRSNKFQGIIGKPLGGYDFPKLRIIDLSNNNFTGYLSTLHFDGWMAMKVDAHRKDQTMSYAFYTNATDYFYTISLTNKGTALVYTKIPESLTGIDLSSNNFIGEIPNSIATLKGLHFLNLSKNMLTGLIPFKLNGLTNLESLDLSHNKLSGEIPQQLTDLTALESFDVSFNELTGQIPQSHQFNTFGSSSYQENSGLCGFPLARKCGNIIEASLPRSLEKKHASRTWIEINWKIISFGYASGFVIGVVIGMNRTRGCKRVQCVH